MKSLPSYSDSQPTYEGYHQDIIDKKQPLSSTDEKLLPSPPSPPPMASMAPMASVAPMAPMAPMAFMPEMLPVETPKKSFRRRGCILGWLCVSIVLALGIAVLLLFAIYGIPASHCCSCLNAYDKCYDSVMGSSNNTLTAEKTCLDQFYSCSSGFNDVFFNCNSRLSDRHMACWLHYFDN